MWRLFHLVALGSAIVWATSCDVETRSEPAEQSSLVGTWRLVSSESRADDGQVLPTFGSDPAGMLIYDAGGRMSVHLMQRDRPAFASTDTRRATPDELKAAFDSHVSYFGSYAVNRADGTVSHKLEGCSYPNWTGTTQLRFFQLDGNRLRLSTPPMLTDGENVRVFLVWERMD